MVPGCDLRSDARLHESCGYGECRSLRQAEQAVKECTKWYRHDRVNGWQFNHLEDGHATTDKPSGIQSWQRATWSRYHCWLTDDTPPKVVNYGPEDLKQCNTSAN